MFSDQMLYDLYYFINTVHWFNKFMDLILQGSQSHNLWISYPGGTNIITECNSWEINQS